MASSSNHNKENRFATLSEHDLDTLSALRHEESTKTATRFGSKVFREWLEIRGHSPEFEDLDKNELALHLQRFYGETRKKDGSQYCKQSMISIRAAINRQLHNERWHRDFDIISDPVFSKANHVMEGIFKDLTVKGLDVPKPHCPLEPGDFAKLIRSGTVGLDNPRSLQNLVWLTIALQFGKRGREGWRYMKKDTFVEGIDGEGKRYFCYKATQKEKKYSGGSIAASHRPDARVYEKDGEELCPVRAITLYLSYLSPKIDNFWQKPNMEYYHVSGVWYAAQPLGVNTLNAMMKSMSKAASLPLHHTNHCVHATSCTVMAEAGVQDRDIIKVTGHKDANSLKRYIDRAPASTKRVHSGILASAMLGTTGAPTAPAPARAPVPLSVPDQQNIAEIALERYNSPVRPSTSKGVPVYVNTTDDIVDMNSSCEIELSQACEAAENQEINNLVMDKIPMNFNSCKVTFNNVTFNINTGK